MLISFFSSLSFYLAIFLLFIFYISCFFFEKNFTVKTFEFKAFPLLSKKISVNFYQIFNFWISILTIFSLFGIILCFGMHDFNLYIVYANSQNKLNYIYAIGASWSSYEGSMLLWLVIMSISTFLSSIFTNSKKIINHKTYHLIQHIQCAFQFILYSIVVLIANPFKMTKFNFENGLGFNPLLQDYSLLTHPPILFFGYASTSIIFAQILGFYLSKSSYFPKKNTFEIEQRKFLEIEKNFYRSLKNWILFPLFFLTVGVFLGAHWSYRELGWGGFWAWDPVENVSLLPWLCSVAALHLIFEKDYFSRLKSFFFAFSASSIFILSLFATFVVRSGFINSIHSFAQSSQRGLLLLFLIIFCLLFLASASCIYFKKDKAIQNDNFINKFSLKYFFLFLGSNFLLILAFFIVSSILIPIFYFLSFDQVINLSEKFFEISFGFFAIPILFLINISFFFKDQFKKNFWKIFIFQILFPFFIAFSLQRIFFKNINFLAILNISFAFLTFANTIFHIILNRKNFFRGFAKTLGHFAFALLIFSSVLSINLEKKEEKFLTQQDNQIFLGDFRADLKNLMNKEDDNIVSIFAEFEVFSKDLMIGKVFPELKFFKFEKMQIPESANISYNFFSDIYLVIPRLDPDKKSILVQIYFKPFVNLLWISGFLLALSFIFGFLQKLFIRKRREVIN